MAAQAGSAVASPPTRFGWHRDSPDPRDYSPDTPRIQDLLKGLGGRRARRPGRASVVDWREYFPPVADQGGLSCCVPLAAIGLVRYFERRATARQVDASALFLYKMSRRLLHWAGDSGTKLRTTLQAMVRFGLPPEEYCPYDPDRLDCEPEPFLFCYRGPYAPIVFERLDPRGTTGAQALRRLKAYLAAGFPVAFGFTAFDTLTAEPDIPCPTDFDKAVGGQAVVAVGFDDARRIRSAKGALLVRSSWGEGWGDRGYGWLPYEYVEGGLAADFWTLLKAEWLETGEFDAPTII